MLIDLKIILIYSLDWKTYAQDHLIFSVWEERLNLKLRYDYYKYE